jgi:ribosome-associated translation inhibitor RaiA
MTKYLADFVYENYSIVRVEIDKETEKRFHVGKSEAVVGYNPYVGFHVSKDDDRLCNSLDEAWEKLARMALKRIEARRAELDRAIIVLQKVADRCSKT